MTSSSPVMVRVTHRFKASAERVYDAWLDPAKTRHWLFVTRENTPLVRSEIDARVGGRFSFVDLREGEEVEHTGEYLELDRPRRMVFTLMVPKYSQDRDRVTVDIVPLASGCELTLTTEMAPQYEEYRERTTRGWTHILEHLDASLGDGSPPTANG
ncbi:SRPBCC family protein [Corallococcus terminator]|uniref:SRPBCC domain-containing protein n=1 Tax=Corallococcus terminator TaxID=2316733 RepID=A0A3A8J8T6_9BACT|nr:SRPBCC family protein [Corallococcus terminator]RKG88634.1 SRPBCC domain-containing protein [Corallococcus terminator]